MTTYNITLTNKETGLEITREYNDLFFEEANDYVGNEIVDMFDQLQPQKEVF